MPGLGHLNSKKILEIIKVLNPKVLVKESFEALGGMAIIAGVDNIINKCKNEDKLITTIKIK